MEESKKTWNDQEKKRSMVVKFGGGGGIGAVILLGGVFATAALASAFAVRRKGRSSGKDRRGCHQNSPTDQNNKMGEQDGEENKGEEIIFTDRTSDVYEHPSEGVMKEVERDNDTASNLVITDLRLPLDEEERVKINGGTAGDVVAADQILCSKKLVKDGVSDDGFVIVGKDVTLSEEKLPLDFQNKMPEEDEKTEGQLSKEDVSDDDYSKENKNHEQVYIEEESRQVENTEVIINEVDNVVEGVDVNQWEREEVEGFCSGDGDQMSDKKSTEAIEHEDVDWKERASGSSLATQTVELIVQEDEEKLVKKQEKCDEDILLIIDDVKEEAAEIVVYEKNNSNAEKIVENELIYHENNEATKDDLERKITPAGIDEAKDSLNLETREDGVEEEERSDKINDEAASSDEIVEESSVGSGDSSSESNSEAVWPAESVQRKIEEDKSAVKEGQECDKEKIVEVKGYQMKKPYTAEMGMVKLDHPSNSNKRRMVMATLSLLSSLACSWFFGLSFVSLCLVVFFTMLLLEIHGC